MFAETYEEVRLRKLKLHKSQSEFYEDKVKCIKLKQKIKTTIKIEK